MIMFRTTATYIFLKIRFCSAATLPMRLIPVHHLLLYNLVMKASIFLLFPFHCFSFVANNQTVSGFAKHYAFNLTSMLAGRPIMASAL